MPLYEYVCRACGHAFEELVFGSEVPACPECSAADAERRLSVFSARSGAGERAGFVPAPGPGACGTCGDPRGPGACSLD
jgi:putative FmdB family regulatory protein